MQFFLTHLFEFDFLDFCLDSLEFFKCMTWQSIFSLLLFIHFFSLFWMVHSGQCHMLWMVVHLEASLLIWGSFWKGWLLVRGCSYHFCPEEKYGSKVFPKNGQFLVNVPWGINQGDFRVSRFWDLYFWSLKGFGRFKVVASLDAYQITNYQFPSKTYHFSVAWFSKNSRRSF